MKVIYGEIAEDQIAQALERCALFEGMDPDMDPEAMEGLVREASLKDVPRGGILFIQGDESYDVYVVASGRIRLYRVSSDGAEKTLAVHGDYEVFGDLAAIDGLARSAVAEAMTDSKVVEINSNAFIACLQGSWDLSERFSWHLQVPKLGLRRLWQEAATSAGVYQVSPIAILLLWPLLPGRQ